MYNIDKGTHICDICGFEENWQDSDDYKGSMWECEYCGKHFCTECFIKELGREAFDQMIQKGDFVLCPEHYKANAYHEG